MNNFDEQIAEIEAKIKGLKNRLAVVPMDRRSQLGIRHEILVLEGDVMQADLDKHAAENAAAVKEYEAAVERKLAAARSEQQKIKDLRAREQRFFSEFKTRHRQLNQRLSALVEEMNKEAE